MVFFFKNHTVCEFCLNAEDLLSLPPRPHVNSQRDSEGNAHICYSVHSLVSLFQLCIYDYFVMYNMLLHFFLFHSMVQISSNASFHDF